MTGRKPKPTTAQIAAGDPRKLGKRKLQAKLEAEPKAARGLPPCPDHLTGHARKAWEGWVTELEIMGLDRRPDAQMLEGACVGYGHAVEAGRIIAREGLITIEPVFNRKGEEVGEIKRAHPAVAVSAKCWTQVRAFCSEFGLSPVSRTRLSTEKKDTGADELAALLSKPRQPRGAVSVN